MLIISGRCESHVPMKNMGDSHLFLTQKYKFPENERRKKLVTLPTISYNVVKRWLIKANFV